MSQQELSWHDILIGNSWGSKDAVDGHEIPEFGLSLTGETVPVEVDGVLTPVPRKLAALLTYLESVQVE
jgi:hypothetical protein